MVTLAELKQETWWNREFVPPTLQQLINSLRAFFQVPAGNIGSKGDANHLRGYHRSRNWILNSAYCTNRTYSVTETPGNRSGGNGDWLCAVDITIARDQLIAMCQRLDAAVRSGTLEKVTEWYGNDDGDNRVDGYNNIRNVVATSDDSHLWHCHISLDRGHAGEPHDDLYTVLTGENMALDLNQQVPFDVNPDGSTKTLSLGLWLRTVAIRTGNTGNVALPAIAAKIDELTPRLDAILVAAQEDGDTTVVLDPAALAELQSIKDELVTLPDIAELRDAVADLGEGGAAAVRADAGA